MKTLDEVIDELNYWDTCDAYPESFYDFEVTRDALHYLKEYKEKQKTLEIRAAEYKRGFEQLGVEWSRIKDNPPLMDNIEEKIDRVRGLLQDTEKWKGYAPGSLQRRALTELLNYYELLFKVRRETFEKMLPAIKHGRF